LKLYILPWFIVFLLVGGESVFAQTIGSIAQVSGDVWLLQEGRVWRLNLGDKVDSNNTIITEQKSIAQVELDDGTLLNIGPKTRLKLQQYAKGESSSFNFDVLWGAVRYQVKKIIDPNSAFNVKTTTAAIGIRGTEFEVSMPYPSQFDGLQFSPSASLNSIGLLTTTVDMKEGLVVLTDVKGNEHLLPAGTITTADAYANVVMVVKGAPPEPPVVIDVPKPEPKPEPPVLDDAKVGSKAAVTTGINTSAMQSATITPPRASGFGGR